MTDDLRVRVRQRAGERCEYCGLAQEAEPFLRFHIEHIVPRQHGGGDNEENLALSCPHCNFHKGTNLSAIDPDGGVVTLYHPRRDIWREHFSYDGPVVVGRTATGRATLRLLKMNDAKRLELRVHLLALQSTR